MDLRDRYGKTQIVFNEGKGDFPGLKGLTIESCIKVTGEVILRKQGMENKKLPTGEIEVAGKELEIFSKSPVLPFDLNDDKVNEDLRLKYRFLDLRSRRMMKNLMFRHRFTKAIDDFLGQEGFVNIETPILNKSTPEGARDYVVPSRIHPGKFYALPQSPQIMKQLIMIAGYDKYYQIAKCFRDEDLRSDRQPEFTQLDLEMSFIDVPDLFEVLEKLWAYVFKEVLGVKIKTPFPKLRYSEAMKKYKTDSPDVRKNKSDGKEFAFLWITDYPMFGWDKEEKRWKSMHHPFTGPVDEADFKKPGKMGSKAYDLVLNGVELGSGSIRIHDGEIQKKIFGILGLSEKEAESKFGFLVNALRYGAPPMGGIAFGLDRVLQIMTGSNSIREIIAFPKNKNAYDLMMDSPSEIDHKQMKEVHLNIDFKKKGMRKK